MGILAKAIAACCDMEDMLGNWASDVEMAVVEAVSDSTARARSRSHPYKQLALRNGILQC